MPRRRRPRRPAELLLGRRAADPGARRLPAQPVRQPGQPARPREDDRPRAVGTDRRADHPLRRRGRDVRLDHRHGALPEGAEPGRADHRRRPGGLGLLRWLRPSLPRRGGRRGLLPGGLGARPVRRRHRHQRRGELPHRSTGVRGGGHPDRRIRRHGGRRGDQGGQASRSRRHRRRVQPGLGARLPVACLRRRVDGQLRLHPASATSASAPCWRLAAAWPSCSTSTPSRRCARRSS